jgi:hypothetical protein
MIVVNFLFYMMFSLNMDLPYLLDILQKVKHPLTDSLATYRSLQDSIYIKFHGGSLGKILAGVKECGYVRSQRGVFIEENGFTFSAHGLDYAMDIARKRTDPKIKENGEYGGRFNPVTGRREEGYGIPAILAINIKRYVPDNIDARYCLRAVQINGPIDLNDIVILFDYMEDYFFDFIDPDILAEDPLYNLFYARIEEALRFGPFDITGLSELQMHFLFKNLMLE